MVNIAVVGTGNWGRNLVRNFAALGALYAVCDTDPEALQRMRRQYPTARCHADCDALLADAAVDAVAVATPAESHFAVARQVLLAGRHVFVEKPLAMNVADAEALECLARERGVQLMVGHILLYHPAIIKIREVIDSGELGKLHYIYSNRLNLGKFRTEENILWSFAPHDISAVLYLLDEMPAAVAAHGGNFLNADIADVTLSVLSFKSGVQGHLFVSWLHPFKEQKLILVGDKKMITFDDTVENEKLLIHDKGVEWINRRPVPRDKARRVIEVDAVEPLRRECAHFIECVRKQARPKTDGRHGVAVLRILAACQASLENNGGSMAISAAQAEAYFHHDTAHIAATARIGADTKIWHFSHVMDGARIGARCRIGQNVVISPGAVVGNNVKIQNNVSVYDGVVLEDDVFCGPSMVFTNVVNPRSHIPRRDEFKATLVRQGATIGANATVVCGHTIGRFAFVAAGAVVTRDVPDYALVMGNPGRRVGWMCACGMRLEFENGRGVCATCGQAYRLEAGRVAPKT